MINASKNKSIWGKIISMATVFAATISLSIVAASPAQALTSVTVDYLVVGGGGGGGARYMGGGGGAGGFLTGSSTINSGNYSITVGNGGLGGQSENTRGNNGGNSVFNGITAYGGGGGGSWSSTAGGLQGGSGGGNSGYSQGGGASPIVAGQGNSGAPGNIYGGGGGGGAGSTGYQGSSSQGGTGGSGRTSDLSGTTRFYAAGGGGGSYTSGSGSAGGSGIGGNGANGPNTAAGGNPTAGVANTGSGGGGANGYNGTTAGIQGGAGGSGIVVIRYVGEPVATGGTITFANGYTIHTFTSSGTFAFTEPSFYNGTAGTIILWSTPITAETPLPAGWILADGTTYNNSQYPDLAAAIGTTHGGTAGSTFTVPNLSGRVPVGYTASQTEFNAYGTTKSDSAAPNGSGTLGAKYVSLTEAQMASHTHTTNSHGHTSSGSHRHYQYSHAHSVNSHGHGHSHDFTIARVGGGGASEIEYGLCCWYMPGAGEWYGAHWQEWGGGASGTYGTSTTNYPTTVDSNTTQATNSYTGGTNTTDAAQNGVGATGLGHLNMQPYTTMYYIIKT